MYYTVRTNRTLWGLRGGNVQYECSKGWGGEMVEGEARDLWARVRSWRVSCAKLRINIYPKSFGEPSLCSKESDAVHSFPQSSRSTCCMFIPEWNCQPESPVKLFNCLWAQAPTQTHAARNLRAVRHCIIENLSFSVILRHSQVRRPPLKGMLKEIHRPLFALRCLFRKNIWAKELS